MDIKVKDISTNVKYWMIRTNSGNDYTNFINGKYVEIGYDIISTVPQSLSKKYKEEMRNKFNYYSKQRIGRVIGAVHTFQHKMCLDDIVIIPAHNKNKAFKQHFSIGIIKSEMYQENKKKRRRVEWIKKHVSKEDVNIIIRQIFYRYSTISSVDEYKEYINNIIFPIYMYDKKIKLHVRVKKQGNIESKDIASILNYYNDIFEDDKDIVITSKININSPGDIMIIIQSNIDTIERLAHVVGYLWMCGAIAKTVIPAIGRKIQSSDNSKVNIKLGKYEFDFELNNNKKKYKQKIISKYERKLQNSETDLMIINNNEEEIEY